MRKQYCRIIETIELYSYLVKVCEGSTETVRKPSYNRNKLNGGLLCANAKLMEGEWQGNSKSTEVG